MLRSRGDISLDLCGFQSVKIMRQGIDTLPYENGVQRRNRHLKTAPMKRPGAVAINGCRARFFFRLFINLDFCHAALAYGKQTIDRQGDIPCGAHKPPYQNDAANKPAQNEIEGDNPHRTA